MSEHTPTGRRRLTEPNIQNIPIRTEIGREVRDAFLRDEAGIIRDVDFASLEEGIMKHFTRKKTDD